MRWLLASSIMTAVAGCGGSNTNVTPDAATDAVTNPTLDAATDAAPPNPLSISIITPDGGWHSTFNSWVDVVLYSVVQVEVDLDGVVVGPFNPPDYVDGITLSLVWDALAVTEGTHTLTVRAFSASGEMATDSITVHVDITPPVILSISTSQPETPHDVLVDILEEGSGVASAQLSFGTLIDLIPGDPWSVPMTGCYDAFLYFRVTDVAGNMGDGGAQVTAISECDHDCDTVELPSCGGIDCDDADPTIPNSNDPIGDFEDSSCDGVDGIDADGDGVPTAPDGIGPDCDDADPLIHGYWGDWIGTEIVTGNISALTLALSNDWAVAAYLEEPTGSSTQELRYIRRNPAGSWLTPTTLSTVGISYSRRPDVAIDDNGRIDVAYADSSSRIVRATNRSGAMVKTVVDPGPGAVNAFVIDAAGKPHVNFDRYLTSEEMHAIGPFTAAPDAIPVNGGWMIVTSAGVTIVGATGPEGPSVSTWTGSGWSTPQAIAPLATQITGVAIDDGDLVVEIADGAVLNDRLVGGSHGAWPGTLLPFSGEELTIGSDGRIHVHADHPASSLNRRHVFSAGRWMREILPIDSALAIDAGGKAHALVKWGSQVFFAAEGTPIEAAADPASDGADRDCDGLD